MTVKGILPGLNNSVNYIYDSILGRLNEKNINGSSYRTTYSYKAGANNSTTTKISSINNNGSIISYTYDSNGNIETITEGGKKIRYYYDELNELIREDNQVTNSTVTYDYDKGGNLAAKTEYPYTEDKNLNTDITQSVKNNLFGDEGFEGGTATFSGKTGNGLNLIATGNQISGISPYSGQKYLFIDGSSNDNYVYLNPVVPVTPGKKYTISFYHKEDSVNKVMGTSSYLKLSDGSHVLISTPLYFDQVWRKYEFTWTCPNGITSIQMRFGFQGQGYSFFCVDDLKVLETLDTNNFEDNSFEEGITTLGSKVGTGGSYILGPNNVAGISPYAGNKYMYMIGTGINQITLNEPIWVTPGKTYDISFYHKEDDINKSIKDESGIKLSNGTFVPVSTPIYFDQVWRKHSISWTCPIGVTSIQLVFGFNSTAMGFFCVDDVEITTEHAPLKITRYKYEDTNWKDKLTSYDGKPITYDAIGNPLTYDGYTYTWEEGRHLSSISGNGKTISYKYNDAGIRTQKTVNGVTTNYHLVGDKVTYEDNGTDNVYYTYDSSDNLVSMNLNGVEYFYIRNAQGDIIGLFDKAGTTVVSYTYDTWGKLVSIDGSLKDSVGVKNPYRYRGYRYDTETGLYYLQSRYYNPEWGRFINADAYFGAKGELLSHNLYAYCGNNPVNREDASGYFFRTIANRINEYLITTVIAIFAVVETIALNNLRTTTEHIKESIGNIVNTVSKSISKSKASSVSTTKKKNQSTTNLYRAMDYIEYNRFVKSGGKLSNNAPERPNVMDTKWFATTPAHADVWGKALNPSGYKIVQVTIPTNALKGMYYNQFLDGIGPAYNGTVPYMNANIISYGTVR